MVLVEIIMERYKAVYSRNIAHYRFVYTFDSLFKTVMFRDP